MRILFLIRLLRSNCVVFLSVTLWYIQGKEVLNGLLSFFRMSFEMWHQILSIHLSIYITVIRAKKDISYCRKMLLWFSIGTPNNRFMKSLIKFGIITSDAELLRRNSYLCQINYSLSYVTVRTPDNIQSENIIP